MLDALGERIKKEHKARFAVNLGDLIQDTTEHGGDIAALKFMFDRLSKIGCPCYSVLGNHDLKMMDSVREVEEIMGRESTYSFDTGGYHFVFLTTEVRSELGIERGGCYKAQYMSGENISWLHEDLKKNSLPTLIFTHYGLAENPEISDGCMFMKNRAEIKEIIKNDKNILAVFSGHQHVPSVIDEDGVRYYVLGSMIADESMTDTPLGEYLEIDLEDGEIKVTERRIKKDELRIDGNGVKV
jgi:predicted phosphodiesterase